MTLTTVVTNILAGLTVLGQIFVVFLVIIWLLQDGQKLKVKVYDFIGKYALAVAFGAAFIATVGSLFYSEVAGYEPCKLCWLQRIFMYPQVILFGLALWKRERLIVPYTLILSLIGAFIAAYHYLVQVGIVTSTNCGAVGYSVSCAQRFVMTFGYITIPMMALTAFVVMIIALNVTRKKN